MLPNASYSMIHGSHASVVTSDDDHGVLIASQKHLAFTTPWKWFPSQSLTPVTVPFPSPLHSDTLSRFLSVRRYARQYTVL